MQLPINIDLYILLVKNDLEKFCEKVVSGKGNVDKCLMKNKFDQEMCKDCQQELARRQTLIGEDVNVDERSEPKQIIN
jgi:hypothetical protein